MAKLTNLQEQFIKNIKKESVNKKELLKTLNEKGIMNGMQAGACITTLRKKGLIEVVNKDIKLTDDGKKVAGIKEVDEYEQWRRSELRRQERAMNRVARMCRF